MAWRKSVINCITAFKIWVSGALSCRNRYYGVERADIKTVNDIKVVTINVSIHDLARMIEEFITYLRVA